jgi:galactonate dehydratase
MVGTGLTTAFMLHFAATLSHATWPAVTCHEIYIDDLIQDRIEIKQGFAHVPEAAGLGVVPDEEAIARYQVEPGYSPAPPRALYRVTWPSGLQMTYSGRKHGCWDDFMAGNQPLFHQGVGLDILPDDGSPGWEELHQRVLRGPVCGQEGNRQ